MQQLDYGNDLIPCPELDEKINTTLMPAGEDISWLA